MSENKTTKKRTAKSTETEEIVKVEETVVAETVTENIETEEPVKEVKTKSERKQSVKEPVKPKYTIPATVKDMFLKSIAKTPYSIYQNGKLIAAYTPMIKLIVDDSGFTVHNKKFAYAGIEVKHA